MTGGWLLVLASSAVHLAESARAEPAPDDRKHYVGRSLEACEVIDYACPNGWSGFQDMKGCGCLSPPTLTRKKAKSKKPCAKPAAGAGRRRS